MGFIPNAWVLVFVAPGRKLYTLSIYLQHFPKSIAILFRQTPYSGDASADAVPPSLWYQYFVRLVWCRFHPSPMRFWCHSTARGRTIILLAGPQKTPALSEGIPLAVSPNLVPLRFLWSENAPESRNIVLPWASLSPSPNSSAKSPKTVADSASHASLSLL